MAQAAPTKGEEIVFPEAIQGVKEFVEHAAPDLMFVLTMTETMLQERVGEGHAKYGTYLQTFNGRDALKDAWEEAADLTFYLQQAIMERPEDQVSDLFDIADLAREALLRLTEMRVAKAEGIRGGR